MTTEVKLTQEQIIKATNDIQNQIIDIITKSTEFHGQLDDLYKAVGIVVVGQLFGWRVMRLITTRMLWSKVCKIFGDPKALMPPEGPLVNKSVGYRTLRTVEDFWEVIRGHATVDPAIKRMIA